jgi:hypothetical protein
MRDLFGRQPERSHGGELLQINLDQPMDISWLDYSIPSSK